MDNWTDWLIPIISTILGGGGIFALFKYRPEAAMVVVKSAEGVVVMQENYITTLTARIEECQEKADSACSAVDRLENELRELRDELFTTRRQRDALDAENVQLKARVLELENRVHELENRTPPGGTSRV